MAKSLEEMPFWRQSVFSEYMILESCPFILSESTLEKMILETELDDSFENTALKGPTFAG